MGIWYDDTIGAKIPDGWELSSCRRLEGEDGFEGLCRMEARFGRGQVRWGLQRSEARWTFLVASEAIRRYSDELAADDEIPRGGGQ